MKKVTILSFFTMISTTIFSAVTLYEYKREFREEPRGRRSNAKQYLNSRQKLEKELMRADIQTEKN